MKAADVMTVGAATIRSDASVPEAERLMLQYAIRHPRLCGRADANSAISFPSTEAEGTAVERSARSI